MPPVSIDNATLAAALGSHAFRVQGIEAGLLSTLGHPNLVRLTTLLSEAADGYLAEGPASREALQISRAVREHIEQLLVEQANSPKPVFPRLRSEAFQAGDEVVVYVGDTFSGAAWTWIPGTVTAVDESQGPEPSEDGASPGYYWRITAELHKPPIQVTRLLAFSISEPRVVLRRDFGYLINAFEADLSYLAMYCANARRDWPPIWALEGGRNDAMVDLPLARWLLREPLHPELRALRPWQ
jgi:hypothetical protein